MKKASLFGLLWWFLVATEVSVVNFGLGLGTQTEHGFVFLPAGVAVHLLLLAVIGAGMALLYFRKQTPSVREVATAALTIALVGLLLDAALTVPMFVKSYPAYFTKWTLWVGELIFLGAFTSASLRGQSSD
jgi:hypothetical protein